MFVISVDFKRSNIIFDFFLHDTTKYYITFFTCPQNFFSCLHAQDTVNAFKVNEVI